MWGRGKILLCGSMRPLEYGTNITLEKEQQTGTFSRRGNRGAFSLVEILQSQVFLDLTL
jgi:hypothetical protein